MTDGNGLPIGCVLTQGNRNECPVFDELLDDTLTNAGGTLPDRLAADGGTAPTGSAGRSRRWAWSP
jgi:hypothetical protein